MDASDLQYARRRLEKHLDSKFSQSTQYEIGSVSVIGDSTIFKVKFYTKALANSEIVNDTFSIQTTKPAECKELHTLETVILAKHDDLM